MPLMFAKNFFIIQIVFLKENKEKSKFSNFFYFFLFFIKKQIGEIFGINPDSFSTTKIIFKK